MRRFRILRASNSLYMKLSDGNVRIHVIISNSVPSPIGYSVSTHRYSRESYVDQRRSRRHRGGRSFPRERSTTSFPRLRLTFHEGNGSSDMVIAPRRRLQIAFPTIAGRDLSPRGLRASDRATVARSHDRSIANIVPRT